VNILSLIVVSILYGFGIILLYISYLSKKKEDRGAYINNISNSIIFIISITLNLIIVNFLEFSNIDFIIFPFDVFMLIFILIFLPLFYISIYREKKSIQLRYSENPTYSFSTTKELPLKYDFYRKLTHLVVLAIVFFYFTIGFWVQNIFLNILDFFPDIISDLFLSIYNIEGDKMIFTQYLVVFLVGISLVGFLTADFTRILRPELYPLKPVNKLLREKELGSRLGPHISMAIGCFSIIILYGLFQPIGPIVICSSMTMAIFGDITANLIGRLVGKKKIKNSKKTYEGLVAGILMAFFSGIISLIFLNEFYSISPLYFLVSPSIGASIFGLIDYFNFEIDDNLTNNFLISTILFFISFAII
jgi:CDP-diglyceride synthetase